MTPISLPQEHTLRLHVNGAAAVGLVCTDEALRELILGYLFNEGMIEGPEEIRTFEIASDHASAWVALAGEREIPTAPVRPSGLGGFQLGTDRELGPMPLCTRYLMEELRSHARRMEEQAVKYAETGGVHCSALFDTRGQLSLFEDIGRHNTLDKLAGDCLLRGITVRDALLITSGRISSDMVRKAARLGASVIASRSTPTGRAFDLARGAGMTLIGYLGKARERIFCAEERIL